MGKLSDVIAKMSFETQAVHTIQFDPNADTVVLKGRNGDFTAIPVKEGDVTMYLALSNQSLIKQLQSYKQATKLKITREGTSFATTYKVEQVK